MTTQYPKPSIQLAVRLLGAAVGAALTISCLLGLAAASAMMTPYAPQSATEIQQTTIIGIALMIPLVVGVLGLIGPKRRWVSVSGSWLVYLVSPIFLLSLPVSGLIPLPSEEASWMALYVIVAGCYWLCPSSKRLPSPSQP